MDVEPGTSVPATRVAVLLPYWSFWESSAAGQDLRQERAQLLAEVVDALEAGGIVVGVTAMLDGPDPDDALLRAVEEMDVVLAVVTMAAPPQHTLAAISSAWQPLIVWAMHLGAGSTAAMGSIVQDGATVGTPQLTNVLVRQSRWFGLVSGPLDPPTVDRCLLQLRAAGLARHLPHSRLGRVGAPIPGYLSVDAADASLARVTGATVRRIDEATLRARALAVTSQQIVARRERVARDFDCVDDLDTATLDASIRFDIALEGLIADERLTAGALNCHLASVRFDPDISVAPCFALGESTTRGVPWTCTGDVLTAVAMLVGRHLGGAALYHEIESLDERTGVAVVANTGEHDRAWLREGHRPQLRANPWYAEDRCSGAIGWLPLRPGAATLLGFTILEDGPATARFVTARVRVLDEVLEHNPTSGGALRFEGPAPESWERWVRAGVNHHSALVPGDITEGVATLAALIDAEHVRAC